MFLQMGMVRTPILEILRGDARRSLFGKVVCPIISECKVPGLVTLDSGDVAFDLYQNEGPVGPGPQMNGLMDHANKVKIGLIMPPYKRLHG